MYPYILYSIYIYRNKYADNRKAQAIVWPFSNLLYSACHGIFVSFINEMNTTMKSPTIHLKISCSITHYKFVLLNFIR